MKSFPFSTLSVFLLVLFTVGLIPYLTSDAFAASPTITAFIGNDPDDGDTVFGAGDTLTITTDIATNATIGTVSNAAFVTGNFTFALPDPLATLTFTTDWTAEWIDASNLVITFININNVPVISTSTVDTTVGNTIGDQTADNAGMTNGAADILSGDFGLFTATSPGKGSGCRGDCEEPTLGVDSKGKRMVSNGFTYNGKSIDVERFFTPYPLITVDVGKENKAEFKIYENQGPDNIKHFSFAFGLAKGEIISESKAMIELDIDYDGTQSLTITDPEHALDNVRVETSEVSCDDSGQTDCLGVTIYHTFRAPLDFNIVATDVWDFKRNPWQNYYNHGIEIVGQSMNPPKEYDGINKGHIYHLTETSKTTAVDEFGNSWYLDHGLWVKDYIPNKRIDPATAHGIDRNNSYFNMYKSGQSLLAENRLDEICPGCFDESYDKLGNIFTYDFPDRINKLDDPAIQSKMMYESVKAQKTMNHILYR